MNNDKDNAISRTQAFWKKKRGYILTDEEARRVNESVNDTEQIDQIDICAGYVVCSDREELING